MAPPTPAPTQILINYGTSSNVAVTIGTGMTYASLVDAIVKGGGYWNGLTFIALGQITSIVAS